MAKKTGSILYKRQNYTTTGYNTGKKKKGSWPGPWPNSPMSSLTTPTPPLPLAHIPLLLPQTFQTWSCLRALAPTLPSAWKALPLACSLSLSPTLLSFLLRHHPIQNAPLSQSFFPLILVCFSLPQGRKNFCLLEILFFCLGFCHRSMPSTVGSACT